MDINEINMHQAMKDHLMRNEGKHPANDTEMHRNKHNYYGDRGAVDENAHGVDLV